MKLTILGSFLPACILALVSAVSARAQAFEGAVFINAGTGLAAHDNGAFSDRLRSYRPSSGGEELLYQTSEFRSAGTTVNAGAGVMFGGGVVVGVVGERLSFPTVRSIGPPGASNDEYDLSAMSGGIDLGYAAVNDGGMLIYPFVHAGYCEYSLEYRNMQSAAIPFFEGRPVAAGSSAAYTGAGARWALGLSMVKILGADGSTSGGGLTVGARLAWGMMASRAEWLEPDGSVVNNGGLTPGYNGVTLSISLGGALGWR
jgi:hypothetical protein